MYGFALTPVIDVVQTPPQGGMGRDSDKREKKGSFAASPYRSVVFHLESGKLRLQSVRAHSLVRYSEFMMFSVSPFLKNLASDLRLINTICDGDSIEPYVNGLGNSCAKVFQRGRHGLSNRRLFVASRVNRVMRLLIVERRIDLEFAARDALQVFRASLRDYKAPLRDGAFIDPQLSGDLGPGFEVAKRYFGKHAPKGTAC